MRRSQKKALRRAEQRRARQLPEPSPYGGQVVVDWTEGERRFVEEELQRTQRMIAGVPGAAPLEIRETRDERYKRLAEKYERALPGKTAHGEEMTLEELEAWDWVRHLESAEGEDSQMDPPAEQAADRESLEG